MFIETQSQQHRETYSSLLNAIGSLSKLFSESPEPYLASRATENIFCKSFEAENLSRSDVSADASKSGIGFGIKTFLEKNGRSLQKIAEFNSDHQNIKDLPTEEKVRRIATLRNERLQSTKRIFGLDNIIYHCITRQVGRISIFETTAPLIDLEKIRDIKLTSSGASIQFRDNEGEYSFNMSKSTLFKRFFSDNILMEIPIRIIDDPYSAIGKIISDAGLIFAPIKVYPHIFLPLYSTKRGYNNVPEKSGLNQWNASGRPRNADEIYIPIPSWIHQSFPNFFPPRDHSFTLTLPDRNTLSAKVCQDNNKALMSNPNSALGNWLLRDILNLEKRKLLTYEMLQTIGLDTVVIYKIDNETYDIDFTRIGSYENFASENGRHVIETEHDDD